MIKGITFNIPNEEGDYLFNILNCIDIKKYTWYISDDDVLDEDDKCFFENSIISGELLYNKLLNEKTYVINLNLSGYIEDTAKHICFHTYEEFEKSKCSICLIIIDCTDVEIYFRDEMDLKDSYNYFKNYNIDVKYIDDKRLRASLDIF
ncbi:DUF2691 family protein [Clostridium sp. LP20]|uniref:DUF2691 family protein n=1 Tax=Clostridium sp. LP20 TaxID=3418665 RepID=UPI003EE769B4